MRWLVLLAGLSATGAAQAQAPKCGNNGSPDVIRLLSWKAERSAPKANSPPSVKVTIEIENVGAKATRMIDAAVWFTDALGGHIGGVTLTRDLKLPAGGKAVEGPSYFGAFERLPDLRPNEVTAIVCTKAALYEDGEKAAFR